MVTQAQGTQETSREPRREHGLHLPSAFVARRGVTTSAVFPRHKKPRMQISFPRPSGRGLTSALRLTAVSLAVGLPAGLDAEEGEEPEARGDGAATNQKPGWVLARGGNTLVVQIWREPRLVLQVWSPWESAVDSAEAVSHTRGSLPRADAVRAARKSGNSREDDSGAGNGKKPRSLQIARSCVSSCVAGDMPQTRSQAQTMIRFPKKKLPRTLDKTQNSKKAQLVPTNVQTTPCSAKILPLSPRKRLGEDNLCNTPHLAPCSPPKQGRKENGPLRSRTRKGRRLVFDDQLTVKSPSRRQQARVHQNKPVVVIGKGEESQAADKQTQTQPLEKAPARLRLFKQEGTCYQQAKLVLNTAVPDRLPAREAEMEVIRGFLREHICRKQAGSLYLSGAPGTGKTACLSRVLQDLKKEVKGFKTILLNCMSLRSSQAVFPAIAREIGQEEVTRAAGKDIMRKLETQMTVEKGPMIVLVLDEMDQLDSRGQDVLYTLFEWPWLSNSRLVLIGVANTLDLTERTLPRLQAREGCQPQLLNFPPYTRAQIAAILQDRLQQVAGDLVLDSAAVQFCARKVSAVSGDIRKALDVCRRAIEIVESDVKSQTLLKPLSECLSPSEPVVPKRVGLAHIARVISEVDGDRMAPGTDGAQDSFPLQQKILVCSLLLLTRQLKVREVTLGKLYEAYSSVCRRQQVAAVDQSECLSLAGLLESRGIVGLKKNKETRFTKVSLKIEEQKVEHALKDRALVGNILATGLP